MTRKGAMFWIIWLLTASLIAGYLGAQMFTQEQKPDFLIGQTSHGHFQIELECSACHTDPFGGPEVLQNACVDCHGAELKESQDSHPRTKFTDPRNAARLEKLDARFCISCHVEHNPEITHPMGVSLPKDFCFHCHQDIAEDRPSHEGMEFETCASAGCHNYHDNRALYEDFLVKHSDAPWLIQKRQLPSKDVRTYIQALGKLPEEIPSESYVEKGTQEIQEHWLGSAHAKSNVGCSSCHTTEGQWQEKPETQVCSQCHEQESIGFEQGKHGMRLAQGLSPMTPQQSIIAHNRLAFDSDNQEQQLTCSTCHNPHTVDVQQAAVESCLSCHQDEHSQTFVASPHGQLWQSFQAEQIPESEAISCATCHMPRIQTEHLGIERILVQHNQNDTLRPNEKMIRPVCLSCHGLAFSIDALADESLIKNNFSGRPEKHIESIDMSLERLK